MQVSDSFKKQLGKPRGVDIEIIDRNTAATHEVLMPSAVRINGTEILIPEDAKIQVHEMSSDELVTVTLTMLVRSLTITTERRQADA